MPQPAQPKNARYCRQCPGRPLLKECQHSAKARHLGLSQTNNPAATGTQAVEIPSGFGPPSNPQSDHPPLFLPPYNATESPLPAASEVPANQHGRPGMFNSSIGDPGNHWAGASTGIESAVWTPRVDDLAPSYSEPGSGNAAGFISSSASVNISLGPSPLPTASPPPNTQKAAPTSMSTSASALASTSTTAQHLPTQITAAQNDATPVAPQFAAPQVATPQATTTAPRAATPQAAVPQPTTPAAPQATVRPIPALVHSQLGLAVREECLDEPEPNLESGDEADDKDGDEEPNAQVPESERMPVSHGGKYGFVEGAMKGNYPFAHSPPLKSRSRFQDWFQALSASDEGAHNKRAWLYIVGQHATATTPFIHYVSPRLQAEALPEVKVIHTNFSRMLSSLLASRRRDAAELAMELDTTKEKLEKREGDVKALQKAVDKQQAEIERQKAIIAELQNQHDRNA
ncbi:hypothetical protein NP233_g12573 [Leucocoprinus birnbaumii]|uniref:Uncharacterized protein n=1 Tax=Leucocoprinus birnbaumii TaxID=56174 RepID=A0AAD5VE68_9AGAR|nr:hypothetical protein NP233_g12573 [Leucocoprinus birnbaumii]